jgi:hypothetical protein
MNFQYSSEPNLTFRQTFYISLFSNFILINLICIFPFFRRRRYQCFHYSISNIYYLNSMCL